MEHLSTIVRVVTSKQFRPWLSATILLITVLLIGRFFVLHPDYLQQLKHANPLVMAAVVLLYLPMIGILIWMYDTTVKLCGKRLPIKETALLTAYSTIINFFGPLQSGPGVRAAYLRAKHQVRLRDYTLATLMYYGIYAFFSALFLLAGSRPWWQTIVGLCVVAAISLLVITRFMKRAQTTARNETTFALRGKPLIALTAATFSQVALTTLIYFLELRAVNPAVHFNQAVSYAGAADFSLFVALTPGAIGFRESFLVFSQNLHHVSTANILNASIIDRGAYIILLLLLLIIVVSVHAKDKLGIKKLKASSSAPE